VRLVGATTEGSHASRLVKANTLTVSCGCRVPLDKSMVHDLVLARQHSIAVFTARLAIRVALQTLECEIGTLTSYRLLLTLV
jgi:hypothetical protein